MSVRRRQRRCGISAQRQYSRNKERGKRGPVTCNIFIFAQHKDNVFTVRWHRHEIWTTRPHVLGPHFFQYYSVRCGIHVHCHPLVSQYLFLMDVFVVVKFCCFSPKTGILHNWYFGNLTDVNGALKNSSPGTFLVRVVGRLLGCLFLFQTE